MSKTKETSDALSRNTVRVEVPNGVRTAGDYVALALATCGVGMIPLAPGTWGSAVGVLLYLAVGRSSQVAFDYAVRYWLDLSPQTFPVFLTTALLLVIFVVSIVGTWAATRAEKLFGKKDPGAVVVDEVAGQLVTYLFAPWGTGWWAIVAGFVAFRAFDIWKPYPVPGGDASVARLGVLSAHTLEGF